MKNTQTLPKNPSIEKQQTEAETDKWENGLEKSAGNEISETGRSTPKRATVSEMEDEGSAEEKDLSGDRAPYIGPKT